MGIVLASNFDVKTGLSLDSRATADTINDRDNIPKEVRYEGLGCYVKEDGCSYKLIGGIENSNWTLIAYAKDYVPKTGGAFTGSVTLPITSPTDDAEAVNKKYVDSKIDSMAIASNAMRYKGNIAGVNTSPGAYTPEAEVGDFYVISTEGYLNGIKLEVGDSIICVTDTAAANSSNYTDIKNNWNYIQSNVDIFIGATSDTAGKSGLIPTPPINSQTMYLKGDGTWSSISQSDVTDLTTDLDSKADKQTSTGGFVGGNNARLDNDSYSGAAIGKDAYSIQGGGAVGEGAIGDNGGGVGNNAQGLYGGGAVGYYAKAKYGGAVGSEAVAGSGFAGGFDAICDTGQDGDPIDAIQLGTGTNSTEKTLQVYQYTLMDANGQIPTERMTNALSGIDSHTHTNKDVLDGITTTDITNWNNKADKQTEEGGFVGGNNAKLNTSGLSGAGAAIGKGAISEEGGGAVGEGAIGDNGGGVGYNAQGLNGGGAVGYRASALYGGAVGSDAKTERGFAGGYNAKTVNSNDTAIDAIQLGTGTNNTPKTLQVYTYQLMDANGQIPKDRMTNALSDKADSHNVDGGFTGGSSASTDTGGAIGNEASSNSGGGAVGNRASASDGGGAVGDGAETTTGFAGGYGSTSETGGAIGSGASATTGGAVGEGASATFGGGAVGNGASATFGGAVGSGASEDGSGGAIGYNASAIYGGGAVGNGASADMGGAVGNGASATSGGAVGKDAAGGSGFAGGYKAQTVNGSNTPIDAIQLGTGTNSTEKTLQVYQYTLMDANGQIPKDRMTNALNTALSDHANIKKNSASTSGDIISGHLTIGTRASGNTYGSRSLTSGGSNTATSQDSVSVGGQNNNAKAIYSANVGGTQNTISASYSANVGGSQNTISAKYSANFGGLKNNVSAEKCATIGGEECSVSSPKSVTVGGNKAKITGWCSNTLGGSEITAQNFQVVAGHLNKIGTDNAGSSGTNGDAFIIGNGASDTSRSNAFRVTYAGGVYALSSFKSTGADYGEYFEWEDGNSNNEDRRGLFVTLNGNKIKLANDGDYIVGVISVNASIIGNTYDDTWQGMYMTDVFGAPLTQIIHHDDEYGELIVPDKDDDGNDLETTHTEQILIRKAYDSEEYIVNPDYDPDQEYISRSERKEWSVVGMFGQLVVIDDGTCTVNSYCKPSKNGIATSSDEGYRVLSRIDSNHIKILIK